MGTGPGGDFIMRSSPSAEPGLLMKRGVAKWQGEGRKTFSAGSIPAAAASKELFAVY